MITWNLIIEGSQKDLFNFERHLMASNLSEEQNVQLFYIRVLIAYNRQDANAIASLLQRLQSGLGSFEAVAEVAKMRLQIRFGSIDLVQIQSALKFLKANAVIPLFKAEALFLSGTAYLNYGLYAESENLFKEASVIFQLALANKKALRSSLCALAAYSCAHPQSRLFYEYTEIYNQCIEGEEYLSAATALVNISREFQILGAQSVALDYIDKAIQLFEKKDRGSREHGLALAHQSELYFEQGLKSQGHSSLLFAISVGNKDVQSACQVVADQYQVNLKTLPFESTLPTWQERATEGQQVVLSPLESQLIQLLSQSPKDKYELMDQLYGELINFESKEGRLKNLLSRLRTRYPDLIVLREQKYHLSETYKRAG